MSNVNSPFGFRQFGRLEGAAPNGGQAQRLIAQADTNAIYMGDPVVSLNTGYIARATAGTTQIAGIFLGCTYLNTAVGRTVWSNFWPGASAGGVGYALIINDPAAMFVAQSNGLPITFANINENINFAWSAGSSLSGISGATLDYSTLAATTTRPFRVIGPYSQFAPPGVNGTDDTASYNQAVVVFNFQDFKSLDGI